VGSISGALVRTYTYDTAGNTTADGSATYAYDDSGRMISATKGGLTGTYWINALGQRVRKSVGGTSTYFVYDESGHLVGEYGGGGALIQETVWFGDIPVATLRPKTGGGVDAFYVHTDHLSTPRRISRPSDNVVVWRWDSDPFGSAGANQDPDGDATIFAYNLRFPGQYADFETGLNYNYFRDYDPNTGRYVQSDPIGLAGGMNTLTYAYASPNSLSDPTGLDVTVNITGRTLSSTGNSISGTINVTSTISLIAPFNGHTIENSQAGENHDKPPVPGGSHAAHIRTDRNPNRIELQNVIGYTNIQIHIGNDPGDFMGCFGVGNSKSLDFIGNSVAAMNEILSIVQADGTGNITVNVGPAPSPAPLGPLTPSVNPFPLGF